VCERNNVEVKRLLAHWKRLPIEEYLPLLIQWLRGQSVLDGGVDWPTQPADYSCTKNFSYRRTQLRLAYQKGLELKINVDKKKVLIRDAIIDGQPCKLLRNDAFKKVHVSDRQLKLLEKFAEPNAQRIIGENFDDFMVKRTFYHRLTRVDTSVSMLGWMCDCPVYMLRDYCLHAICLGLIDGHIQVPNEANIEAFVQSRPGRPRNMGPGLDREGCDPAAPRPARFAMPGVSDEEDGGNDEHNDGGSGAHIDEGPEPDEADLDVSQDQIHDSACREIGGDEEASEQQLEILRTITQLQELELQCELLQRRGNVDATDLARAIETSQAQARTHVPMQSPQSSGARSQVPPSSSTPPASRAARSRRRSPSTTTITVADLRQEGLYVEPGGRTVLRCKTCGTEVPREALRVVHRYPFYVNNVPCQGMTNSQLYCSVGCINVQSLALPVLSRHTTVATLVVDNVAAQVQARALRVPRGFLPRFPYMPHM
jgi:hypothetical protein